MNRSFVILVALSLVAALNSACSNLPTKAQTEIEQSVREQLESPYISFGGGGWTRVDEVKVTSIGDGMLDATSKKLGYRKYCFEVTVSGLSSPNTPETVSLFGSVLKSGDYWRPSQVGREVPEDCELETRYRDSAGVAPSVVESGTAATATPTSLPGEQDQADVAIAAGRPGSMETSATVEGSELTEYRNLILETVDQIRTFSITTRVPNMQGEISHSRVMANGDSHSIVTDGTGDQRETIEVAGTSCSRGSATGAQWSCREVPDMSVIEFFTGIIKGTIDSFTANTAPGDVVSGHSAEISQTYDGIPCFRFSTTYSWPDGSNEMKRELCFDLETHLPLEFVVIYPRWEDGEPVSEEYISVFDEFNFPLNIELPDSE